MVYQTFTCVYCMNKSKINYSPSNTRSVFYIATNDLSEKFRPFIFSQFNHRIHKDALFIEARLALEVEGERVWLLFI